MPQKKQAATEPEVETRSALEIIESRMPHEPTTRELLADRIEQNEAALAKIAAQEKAQAAKRKRIAVATRGTRPGTSDYYRAAAKVS